jgi:hypothetical protein
MTDRERWTVYPLLFLALALAVRDKVMPSVPSTLSARELTILGEDNRPDILLRGGTSKAAPAIEMLNAKELPAWVVSVGGRDGVGIENTGTVFARDVVVVGADGKQRVVLGVTDNGKGVGRTEWYDGKQNLVLAAGGSASDSGAISSFRPGNIPQFSFGTNERGSIVVVRDLKGKPYFVLMGDDQGEGRALLFDAHGNGQLIVGKPVNIQINEVPAPKPEGEATDGEATDGDAKPTNEQPNPDAPKAPPTENSNAPPAEVEPPAAEAPAEVPATEAPSTTPAEESPKD